MCCSQSFSFLNNALNLILDDGLSPLLFLIKVYGFNLFLLSLILMKNGGQCLWVLVSHRMRDYYTLSQNQGSLASHVPAEPSLSFNWNTNLKYLDTCT